VGLINVFERVLAFALELKAVQKLKSRTGRKYKRLQDSLGECIVGSFALLVASAAITIPWGRMTESDHPLGRPERELQRAIRQLKRRPFLKAPFWANATPEFFRYAKIVNDPENAGAWRDRAGNHPLHSTEIKDGNTVLRTVRHALAHGNVVYLDEHGRENPDTPLRFLAFLSKHEVEESHRVAIFGEEDFLIFLKGWIAWLQTFPPEGEFIFGEAAE
jgi:hypothetical protein